MLNVITFSSCVHCLLHVAMFTSIISSSSSMQLLAHDFMPCCDLSFEIFFSFCFSLSFISVSKMTQFQLLFHRHH